MNLSLCRIISLFLFLLPLVAHGAPPRLRPYTGSGLLVMRPPPVEPGTPATLVFYREPGVGRIVEPAFGQLPQLNQILESETGEYPVAVMGIKGGWLKIAYDEAGRSGWVEMARRWNHIRWEDYLPGRTARFLPWLKKSHYQLRTTPGATGQSLERLNPDSAVRIDRVEGDWLLVNTAPGKTGWLRWRDEEGRFLITVRPDRPR